ncbi:MAG: hypothetical protein WC693_00815 [Patescibacteria group bacterium]|jgi:hypothetical protein
MNEQKLRPDSSDKPISFEEAYQQLQEIIAVLAELGLNIPDYCHSEEIIREQWDDNYRIPFPVARDGADGIRASRRRDGKGFIISFTNGFENSDDPKRMEITEVLREKGFDVV